MLITKIFSILWRVKTKCFMVKQNAWFYILFIKTELKQSQNIELYTSISNKYKL